MCRRRPHLELLRSRRTSTDIDGQSLGTLTATNWFLGNFVNPDYRFTIDAIAVGSGPHTVSVKVTDGNGETTSKIIDQIFHNAPSITLTAPFDGQIVNGALPIAGTFATDEPDGKVTAVVKLGDLEVLRSTTSPFSGSFDLTGVPSGNYTLSLTATDNYGLPQVLTRSVTVVNSANFLYAPVKTSAAVGMIKSALGPRFVYTSNGGIFLHTPDNDGPVPSTTPNIANWTWVVNDHNYVFGSGLSYDRLSADSVVMFAPNGSSGVNLSLAAGSMLNDAVLASVYPSVVWGDSNNQHCVLYNFVAGTQQDLVGCPYANNDYIITVGGGGSGSYNVIRWDQTLAGSFHATDPQTSGLRTDGIRVAWRVDTASASALMSLDLASGATTTLSTTMSQFDLANGLLGWTEVNTGGQALIKVSDGTATTTLSTTNNATFYGSSGGYIFFSENSGLYAWSSSGGRQLLFPASPKQVLTSGKTVYLVNGTAIYKIDLP